MFFKNIFLSSSKDRKKLQAELDMYKKKSLKLEKELNEIKESISNKVASNRTSFMSAKIQKIEDLENEILLQKQRVVSTAKIAQEASKVKELFLSSVDETLKSPLKALLLSCESLMQELKNTTQHTLAKNIFHSGQTLLRVIEQLISLADLESKDVSIEFTAVDTSSFFYETVKKYKLKAEKKSLNFVLVLDEKLPESLMIDVLKVKDIINNLLDNSIKYTHKGSVKIEVVVQEHKNTLHKIDLAIIVTDTGEGISLQNQQNIFDLFKKQNMGIGLCLNKKTAELMNGEITFQSKIKEGSKFTFLLKDIDTVLHDYANEIDEDSLDFTLISPEGANFMIIDDTENSLEIMQNSFASTNVNVEIFNSPRKAIETLKQREFDMIFVDFNILTIDNNAVLKVLSSMSQGVIIPLVSKDYSDSKSILESLRVVGYLSKPISKISLFKISLKIMNAAKL